MTETQVVGHGQDWGEPDAAAHTYKAGGIVGLG